MPQSPFRRKPSAHSASSLLRFLFPQTRARARSRLSKFRHDTLPALKHRAQSRIYKYIVYRQSLKLQGKQSILQRVRGHTRRLIGSGYLENAARARRQHLVKRSVAQTSKERDMTYQESYEAREPGTRRKKLAGYLKAANDIRQSYTQQYAPNWSSKDTQYDYDDDGAGAFPDAAVVRSGEEEMILFPSYARKHVKRKPEAQPGMIQEEPGEGRDVRDTTGAGDAEFWKKQWNNYEDDNAVVDVDVRGWIYSPHKGQMSRKQRLFIGLARQLVGVQAPPTPSTSSASSRDTSPARHGFRERTHLRDAQRDEAFAAREAEEILRKGEREAKVAAMGGYSEKPAKDIDDTDTYRTESGSDIRASNPRAKQLAHRTSNSSMRSEGSIQPLQKRGSWNQPSEMSPAELAEANARLMTRLRHFLAIPMANTPISVFFYNDQISKQRTVYTDASGHFSMSAALDFVPTHVRILASDKLSATEKVLITEEQGISVISDIDDTIKHSAISSGAREIFRNVFIRDLVDLTIDGVREWYNRMAEMGVKFHYVSNSPWQLYPVISKYFSLAGLPPGSFHLKQYSGMLQGIFEPVAERKKVTLDKIARDFPERNFILVGDSGEADLEVYTDFVMENPGRVVAVFIRDVTTTTDAPGFFSPSMGGNRSSSDASSTHQAGGSTTNFNKARPSSEEHDPELRAAIAASLRDLDDENMKRSNLRSQQDFQDHPESRPPLPERRSDQQTTSQSSQPVSTPNLIDLSSDEEKDHSPALRRVYTDNRDEPVKHRTSRASSGPKSAPPPPKKPAALRAVSGDLTLGSPALSQKPAPPQPRKTSTTLNQSSPLAQQTPSTSNIRNTKPAVAPKPSSTYDSHSQDQQSYGGMAREKLWSVYNALPALRSTDDAPPTSASTLEVDNGKKAPPPPPPRRGNRENASSAASYVGSKASAAWQHAPSIPYPNRPQITSAQTSQPFSSAAPRQGLNRTSTGSTIGTMGGEQYGTKREQLWRQRWARAEQVLGEHNVLLRSWRVGSDVIEESERIIKDAAKKWKTEGQIDGANANGRQNRGL
ncbi:actin patch protein 1 [Plenodomus tracheiphilus IPT5]|uniref:Actin patch protein 1 n=1 Tax=Plenodomus tracheiphilus IPT5 TaxID=1408161 RepID=A0A6A7B0R5_9PLEO|nr:actin patch protein 1 [Plenodomus tracheiphilus IPT5]